MSHTIRLFLTFAILCGFYNGANGEVSLDIEMKLKSLNKPALMTIKSEDGDIIDCIDIYKQHAFDHPALRNHKIQMKPSVEFDSEKTSIPNNDSSKPIVSQTWSKSGECPKGTIPVRRVSREDIRRASSPSRFGKKTPHRYRFLEKALHHKANLSLTDSTLTVPTTNNRSEALILTLGMNYIGAQSDINVWDPPRVQPGEYSSAQIWLVNVLTDSFETIEAGWTVNPSLYGDSRARFFTYWTSDGYTKTGCFDLLCPGFVQTTTKFSLGAVIDPVSSTDNDQYSINVGIFLDGNTGNWWLKSHDTMVGYWPGNLFHVLSHSAIAVQWGGEVFSPNVKKTPHTRAAMGSGEWAYYLYRNACYQTNLRIKDYSLQVKYPEYLSEYSAEPECYTTRLHRQNYMAEPFFFFGGPGRNLISRCP